MSSTRKHRSAARNPVRIAVITAAFAVIACFGAALTLVGEGPAKAGEEDASTR